MTYRSNTRVYSMWPDGTVTYEELNRTTVRDHPAMRHDANMRWVWDPMLKAVIVTIGEDNYRRPLNWDAIDEAFTAGYLRYLQELAADL